MSYGYQRTVKKDFDTVNAEIRIARHARGFGVVTEIDVATTIKAKLDKDFRKYQILGACNPEIAFDTLNKEIEVGLLLPCNVILWENNEKSVTVSVIDAVKLLDITGNDTIKPITDKVNVLLREAVDVL